MSNKNIIDNPINVIGKLFNSSVELQKNLYYPMDNCQIRASASQRQAPDHILAAVTDDS